MSKSNPGLIAVAALAAYWLLMPRKAGAGTLGVAGTGTPYYGTARAVTDPAVQRYYTAPAGATARAPAAASPLQSILAFGSSLIAGNRSGAQTPLSSPSPSVNVDTLVREYSQGGPSTGVYGADEADRLQQAYSYGGPSTGVYGLVGGNDAAYAYADGASGVDSGSGSYAPTVDLTELPAYLQENPFSNYAF